MAVQPLSVGDILMLSQTAWKIGRAFTQGKKSAPSEFAEVEREANGLSEALKLVAETLHTDGGTLSRADEETRSAVNTIIESARTTLSDLDSFVERYQIIKKNRTNGGGFVVERSWSEVVMANYKTFQWTTEGGTIGELRNMLQMHTNTIQLTMQALQSRSLSRLEKTVVPMAENIADIHQAVHGDLGGKIDDLHRLIMAVANSTPSLQARDRAIEGSGSVRDSSSTISTLDRGSVSSGLGTRTIEAPPPRNSSISLPTRHPGRRASEQSTVSSHSSKVTVVPAGKSSREDSAYYSMGGLPFEREGRRMDWGFENGSPPDDRGSISNEYAYTSAGASSSSPTLRPEPSVARRESTTLPNLFRAIDEVDAETDEHIDSYYSNFPPKSPKSRKSGPSPPSSKANSVRSPSGQQVLPPPALPPDSPSNHHLPATPATIFGAPSRERSMTSRSIPRPQTSRSSKYKCESADSNSPQATEAPSFDKTLFRNAAILCDVRGTLVEYARTLPDEPDPRFNTEMKEACKECRICVIRKREQRELGGTKVITSIWALSDDGEVRLQQKLSEFNETVPYCSTFDPLKVSLPPPEGAGSEIALKFHAETWGDMLKEEKKTNWVNFVFVTETDAISFQSAVFGRTLLGSYRTTKTTVIHEGLKGAFAFEEQFANIEMLRLWEDDGISTPGAAGGVMALMHVSSNFGDGWARFWINGSKQQVRVKNDGEKWARVKGIDITVVKPGTAPTLADKARSQSIVGVAEPLQRVETALEVRPQGGRRIAVKRVQGVRIEFETDAERAGFVARCKECQEKILLLPDL
ncbi:hypothetical protein LTR62_007017 [Meristemomyces frigidus]|uniref:Fungal N-terminal domain-containing protein n=1 Tax=Meristemomyces frigidus TaxID=1508187 RepID=A0AAN7YML1_9PEZI|nr:hypothetical protein LTR62_007017 [Meristemomyces frigidus]